jgi:hypothetical protein
VAVPIDDVGCFTFGQRPDGPFRLRCHNDAQADVRTGWVTLLAPGGTTLPGTPQAMGESLPHSPPRRGGGPGRRLRRRGCFRWLPFLVRCYARGCSGIALPGRPRHQSGVVPPMIAACTSVLACQ